MMKKILLLTIFINSHINSFWKMNFFKNILNARNIAITSFFAGTLYYFEKTKEQRAECFRNMHIKNTQQKEEEFNPIQVESMRYTHCNRIIENTHSRNTQRI